MRAGRSFLGNCPPDLPADPPGKGVNLPDFPGNPPDNGVNVPDVPGNPPDNGVNLPDFPGNPPDNGVNLPDFPGNPPDSSVNLPESPGTSPGSRVNPLGAISNPSDGLDTPSAQPRIESRRALDFDTPDYPTPAKLVTVRVQS